MTVVDLGGGGQRPSARPTWQGGSSWQCKGMPAQHLGTWRIFWSPIPQTKSYLFMETSLENHCSGKAHYKVPSTRNKALEVLIAIILNLGIEIRMSDNIEESEGVGGRRGKVCSGHYSVCFSMFSNFHRLYIYTHNGTCLASINLQ